MFGRHPSRLRPGALLTQVEVGYLVPRIRGGEGDMKFLSKKACGKMNGVTQTNLRKLNSSTILGMVGNVKSQPSFPKLKWSPF
jgi:hypothetical protein